MSGYRKLKHAYATMLESNKLRAPPPWKETRHFPKKTHPPKAEVEVTGFGLNLGFPSLTLAISKHGNTSLYSFNLNPSTMDVAGKGFWKLSAVFFTRSSYHTEGCAVAPFLFLPKITHPQASGNLSCYGPTGFTQHINKLYPHLLSPLLKEKFYSRVDISEGKSEFIDEYVHVKQITLDPKFIDKDCSDQSCSPTSIYSCELLGFSRELDREKHGDTNEPTRQLKQGNPKLILIDCPTHEHFDCMVENPELKSHLEACDNMPSSIVAHITPQSIFSSPDYQNLVKKFGETCKHIFMNVENRPFYDENKYRQIITFNKISNQLFPPVHQQYMPDHNGGSNMYTATNSLALTIQGHMRKLHLNKFMDEKKYNEISEDIEKELYLVDDVIQKTQQEMGTLQSTHQEHYFPRLTVLGCGAMVNYNMRAQPAFLFRPSKESSMILDCGVHTLEKLYVNFGEKTEDVISTIKLIFISHKHLDHVAGFFSLLEKIIEVRQNRNMPGKVFCLTPLNFGMFFEEYLGEYYPNICNNVEFISVESAWNGRNSQSEVLTDVCNTLGVKYLMPIPVHHSIQTFGIVIVSLCGKKVLYTSDTLPMARHVVQEGKDVDLLIHDCLYVHEEWEMDAKMRKHSTLSGVMQTADTINAKHTLLTHFSPVLPMLPVVNLPEKYKDRMSCAFDNLSVSLHDLPKLCKLEPAVHAVYQESLEKFENRLVRSQLKRRKFKENVKSLFEIM